MKRLLMVAAFSAALVAGPASAQMYLGAGVGASHTDTSETSWKLYGGFQFNPIWGLELAYTDLGRYRSSSVESSSLAGTATLPLAESWSLLGKVGIASNRAHFAGAANHADWLLGVGVGYSMSRNLGVRLEYEDFGQLSDVTTGSNSKGSNVALSVKFGF